MRSGRPFASRGAATRAILKCASAEKSSASLVPGRPIHRRELKLSAAGLEVIDQVLTRGSHRLVTRLHLHPQVDVVRSDAGSATLRLSERTIRVEVAQGSLIVEDYAFSREFGLMEPAKVLSINNLIDHSSRLSYRITAV